MAECSCKWCVTEPGHAGARSRYRSGCRCDECVKVESDRNRAAHERRKRKQQGAGAELPPDSAPGSQQQAPATSSGGSLAGALRAEILFFGSMVSAIDPICGGALVKQAGPIAASLAEQAANDPAVMRWLTRMSAVGGWGGVAIACLPVAQALAMHHVIPAAQRRRERAAQVLAPDEYDDGGQDAGGFEPPAPVPNGQAPPLANPNEFVEPVS